MPRSFSTRSSRQLMSFQGLISWPITLPCLTQVLKTKPQTKVAVYQANLHPSLLSSSPYPLFHRRWMCHASSLQIKPLKSHPLRLLVHQAGELQFQIKSLERAVRQ
ncbi:hypothetical protein BC939DRAFT_525604, partial [Gamsiella multidivaricata]|uniref:uncharacterized protein n=1 Tax=Gamsiella multidivaricata TaxID=101098 RepID=UPI00221E48F2